jgi:hypothetical protein
MPAEAYSFRVTPQIRTFAEELAHIAVTNSRLCRAVSEGVFEVAPKFAALDKETSKPVLIGVLKETFAECDRAFSQLDERSASKEFVTRTGCRVPIGSAMTIVADLLDLVREADLAERGPPSLLRSYGETAFADGKLLLGIGWGIKLQGLPSRSSREA